ncbi:MAG: tripartite tricarboxylate transporter TctB family protein [Comamonadaceae bacterium]|jgi:hypothetical protein|nr:tripartite tricarboxylate transporter TctB family protein [Comamonadaceae bacterium]
MTPLRVALALLLICALAAWQVSVIPRSLMEMAVGASLVPAAVVAGLSLASAAYALSAWRGRQLDESLDPEQAALPGAMGRLLSLLIGGALFMLLVTPMGFVLPATLCGMCIARAFGAPVGLKSLLICSAIAAVFWLVFARLLGVGLGPAFAPLGL